jgi:hypothetical protein
MLNRFDSMKAIQRFINFTSKLNARKFSINSIKRGGGGHHAEQGKQSFIQKYFLEAEHPDHHKGYLYRQAGNLQGNMNAFVGKVASTFAWYFIFYNLWSHPEYFFGHMEYPDASKWTNAELGIPADEEE